MVAITISNMAITPNYPFSSSPISSLPNDPTPQSQNQFTLFSPPPLHIFPFPPPSPFIPSHSLPSPPTHPFPTPSPSSLPILLPPLSPSPLSLPHSLPSSPSPYPPPPATFILLLLLSSRSHLSKAFFRHAFLLFHQPLGVF